MVESAYYTYDCLQCERRRCLCNFIYFFFSCKMKPTNHIKGIVISNALPVCLTKETDRIHKIIHTCSVYLLLLTLLFFSPVLRCIQCDPKWKKGNKILRLIPPSSNIWIRYLFLAQTPWNNCQSCSFFNIRYINVQIRYRLDVCASIVASIFCGRTVGNCESVRVWTITLRKLM